MINLAATTDKIQVVLSSAITTNQLECVAMYRDIDTTTFTPGRNNVDTNGTTDVDLVGAPSSGYQRLIEYLSIYNTDTVSATVTVKYDANGTEYILFKAIISPGESIQYVDGDGWKVISSTGSIKTNKITATPLLGGNLNVVALSADVTNNNASANTLQDITGFSFPVKAGNTYWFRMVIAYTAAATTTGSRWSINGPSITSLFYRSEYSLTATSYTANEGISAYNTPAASNATSASTGANMAVIEGKITPSADGDVIGRFASEVSSSAIVAKAGSVIFWAAII